MIQTTLQPDSRTKAAIIVRLLRGVDADLSLSSLPGKTQLALARAIGTMGAIDRELVNATVEEFAQAVDQIALPAAGGVGKALEALNGQLSPEIADQIAEESAAENPDHAWVKLARLADDEIIPILENESIQIAALLISKLPTAQSARILTKIPGEKARRIALSSPALDLMRPESVLDIARALVEDYCRPKPNNFDKDAVGRVGAILTSTASDRRKDVLEGLDSEDPEFAAKVRDTIFTFENIPERIDPIDVPKIIRALDQDQLRIALSGALEGGPELAAAAEFILENMSKRMAGQLRDDIQDAPPPRNSDVENTHKLLIDSIQDALDSGEITRLDPD